MEKKKYEKYEMKDEEFESVLGFFDKVFKNPKKYPDKCVVLSLKNEDITKIFTPKRLELVDLIKRKQPITVAKLSKITKRKVEGVIRDVGILKDFHIIQHEKKGKEIILTMKQDFIIIPTARIVTFKEIKGATAAKPEAIAEI